MPDAVPVAAVALAVEALASRLPPGSRVLVRGVAEQDASARRAARGLEPTPAAPADAGCLPAASATGPLLGTLEALAEELPEGALVAVSDLMWKTAPTTELLAAFPGTRPMEGYEMQAEHAGFDVVDRLDAPRAELLGADLTPAQRAAVEADDRGAALWRVLLLRRTP